MKRLALVAVIAAVLPSGAAATATAFNPDPVFPIGAISDTTSHQIAKLDRVATKLAGRKTIVNCWSQHDWARLQAWNSAHHYYRAVEAGGLTSLATHRIQLSPFACEVLAQVLAGPLDQPLWDAGAVTLLAHESAHASGIHAENRAECQALKTEPEAAALMGTPKTVGARFQHIYRGTIYPLETPRYNTPPYRAGLPGVVVPDTLGPPKALRLVRWLTTAGLSFFPRWDSIGGSYGFGPLSPCGRVSDRSHELARFDESFTRGKDKWFGIQGATVRTRREFAFAVARAKAEPRCELAHRRAEARAVASHATVSLTSAPAALRKLSPAVHTYRLVFRSGGRTVTEDRITILNRRTLSMVDLYIGPGVPIHDEVDATKATLRAMHSGD